MALLYRLQHSGELLAALVSQVLARAVPAAGRGRRLRLIDATVVPQKGARAKRSNHVWRLHSAFELPAERFGDFVLTDQTEGERVDRLAVETGEIRLADRAYMQPARLAAVLAAGGDVVVRTGWKNARWLSADGQPFDLIGALHAHSESGLIDQPIGVFQGPGQPALGLRLVAVKKSPPAFAGAGSGRRRGPPQGAPAGATGRPPDRASHADRRRLGAAGHLALPPGLSHRRDPGALPLALAYRVGLQTPEKPGRPEGTAGR